MRSDVAGHLLSQAQRRQARAEAWDDTGVSSLGRHEIVTLVTLRSAATKNLFLNVKEKQMLRYAQHDRCGDLGTNCSHCRARRLLHSRQQPVNQILGSGRVFEDFPSGEHRD